MTRSERRVQVYISEQTCCAIWATRQLYIEYICIARSGQRVRVYVCAHTCCAIWATPYIYIEYICIARTEQRLRSICIHLHIYARSIFIYSICIHPYTLHVQGMDVCEQTCCAIWATRSIYMYTSTYILDTIYLYTLYVYTSVYSVCTVYTCTVQVYIYIYTS